MTRQKRTTEGVREEREKTSIEEKKEETIKSATRGNIFTRRAIERWREGQ